jgi:hypothetical protein
MGIEAGGEGALAIGFQSVAGECHQAQARGPRVGAQRTGDLVASMPGQPMSTITTKGLEHVKTEMSLHVLAYNIKRLIAILGIADMMKAIRAFIRLRRLKTAMQAIFKSIATRSLKKNIAPLHASWILQTRQQLRWQARRC